MGVVLTERAIVDEITTDEIDFNIQRLGHWLRYNQKSAISLTEWEALKAETMPELKGKLFVGVKYGRDGTNVAMSIAVKTAEEKIFIETIDCRETREGTAWIVDFLGKADFAGVVIDGANGQQILYDAIKEAKIKPLPMLPTVREIITANSSFELGISQGKVQHMNQPSLRQAASNCDKRAIGTNGGFGYKAQKEEIEIALLDSAIYAYWLCNENKEKKKQKVSY